MPHAAQSISIRRIGRSLMALALILTLGAAMPLGFAGPAAAQAVEQPRRGSALRRTLLDAARPTFESETNGPIEFVVHQLNVYGNWAFGNVKLQRPGGGSIHWHRTRYADAHRQGMFDPGSSFFLLRQSGGVWSVAEFSTGPTDVVWEGWRQDHKLPNALFDR